MKNLENSILEEILELGTEKDFSMEIRTEKPREIKTKTVSLFIENMENQDYIKQPFLFIILPFFASKRERNSNIIYEIKNAGIKFGASLSSDKFEGFTNKQPSYFEKDILDFIMFKFQGVLSLDKNQEYIKFDIKEVIDYLGLSFSPKYYKKVEESLFNLQTTTYKIKTNNKRKAGNIIREVYAEPLNLIRYQKLKEKNIETGKQRIAYRVKLDDRILEELRIKHYSIFHKELLNDIKKKDKAAEKIYQFISMKRFSNNKGCFQMETLATIIPLKTYEIRKVKNKKGETKEYIIKRTSKILTRLKKIFNVLLELEYILEYKVIENEKSYSISYVFNSEKDNQCHKSNYLVKKDELKLSYIPKKEIITKNKINKEKLSQRKFDFVQDKIVMKEEIEIMEKEEFKEIERNLNISDDIIQNLYENLSKYKKLDIDNKAIELYKEEIGKELSHINLKVYEKKQVNFAYKRKAMKILLGI